MRCNYCEWRCELNEESFGRCGMFFADREGIKERFPYCWSIYTVTRIESVPFYHAYPGSRSLSVGTFGCNFRCSYCSNGFIAREDPAGFQDRMFHLSPEALIGKAKKLGCHNIVFNVNEPTVSLPTLMDLRKHADRAGIALGCLTNGYTTEESTDLLASVFSFVNIGLKGFNDDFYRKYIGIPRVAPVLRTIRQLAENCHLEVVTPVIPGANDHELDAMSDFLSEIDPRMPWHIFRLLPEHDMRDKAYPSVEGINSALRSARKKLDHIYFHNFVGSDWVDTLCPKCGTTVIERFSLGCGGDLLSAFHCRDNRCSLCGCEINLLGSLDPGHACKEAV